MTTQFINKVMYNFSEQENQQEAQDFCENQMQYQQQSTFVIEPYAKIFGNQQAASVGLLLLTEDFSTVSIHDVPDPIKRRQIQRRNGGPYKCDHCSREFPTGSALGGHKSRVHPSQSNDYKQKINTALRRAPVRERTRDIQFIIYSDLFSN